MPRGQPCGLPTDSTTHYSGHQLDAHSHRPSPGVPGSLPGRPCREVPGELGEQLVSAIILADPRKAGFRMAKCKGLTWGWWRRRWGKYV